MWQIGLLVLDIYKWNDRKEKGKLFYLYIYCLQTIIVYEMNNCYPCFHFVDSIYPACWLDSFLQPAHPL